MKKQTLLLIALIFCFGTAAFNANAENQKYDEQVKMAINALKQRWTEVYKEDFVGRPADGYLEIKNTRVISLKDKASGKLGYDDLRYIVEFIILTDYFSTHPYYMVTERENAVGIFTDGSVKVLPQNVFRMYHSVTFSNDFSEFIESIHDLKGEYNISTRLFIK